MTQLTLGSTIHLDNGVEMPRLGLGVYEIPAGGPTKKAVLAALAAGYRHIDTAALYANEADVGQAVRERGLPRQDVFVTTKLWNSDHGYALSDRGAQACNRLASTNEPLGRCLNYATQTLCTAIEATTLDVGPTFKKRVIDAAKLSASIAGVLAHAGRARVPAGKDPVEVACLAMWDAIRADIPVLAAAEPGLESTKDRVQNLRDVAPLWIDRAPSWASGV